MTAKNDGGPAFPCEVGPASDGHTIQTGNMQWMQPGMTMRDYFAAKAMQGFAAGLERWDNVDVLPSFCYQMADAMLKARETP